MRPACLFYVSIVVLHGTSRLGGTLHVFVALLSSILTRWVSRKEAKGKEAKKIF